jgi:hypothetical protein
MLATVQYKVDGYPICFRAFSYTIARSTTASGQQEPLDGCSPPSAYTKDSKPPTHEPTDR